MQGLATKVHVLSQLDLQFLSPFSFNFDLEICFAIGHCERFSVVLLINWTNSFKYEHTETMNFSIFIWQLLENNQNLSFKMKCFLLNISNMHFDLTKSISDFQCEVVYIHKLQDNNKWLMCFACNSNLHLIERPKNQ